MVPLAGAVDIAVLGLARVADPVGHVGAGVAREAECACGREELERDVGAPLQLLGREHPGEEVDRLDTGEDPRPGPLDLGQLVAEEQEEGLDDHVGALEDVDGGLVPAERRLPDSPHADLAGGGR